MAIDWKKCALGALLGLAVSGGAMASMQTGQVTQIMSRSSDGLVLFQLSNTATAKPACATHSYWIIRDENSATGKRQLAMLMIARATGQVVRVYGYHACTRWSDGEDADAIEWGTVQ